MQDNQNSVRQPPNRFIQILLATNIATIILPGLIYFYLYWQSKHGSPGMEMIALLLLPIIPFAILTVIINIVYLPIYLLKSRPEIRYVIMASAMLLFSLYVVGINAYDFANRQPTTIDTAKDYSESYNKLPKQYTLDDVTLMMNQCKVDYVIGYNGDLSLVHANSKEGIKSAENSSTGIAVATQTLDGFTAIYASKAMTPQLLSAAKASRDVCLPQKEMHIYEDNTLEIKMVSGGWYKVTDPNK